MASKIRKYDSSSQKDTRESSLGKPRGEVTSRFASKQPGILSRFTWQFLRLDMSWGTFWKQMQHMKTAPKWLARWKKLDLYSRVPVVSLLIIIPITIIHPSFIAAPRKGSVFNYSNKQRRHKSSKKKLAGGWTNPFQKYVRQKWVNIFSDFRAENSKRICETVKPSTTQKFAPKNQMCHLFLRPHPSRDHTSCSASNFINLSSKGNCFASNDVEVLKIWPPSNIAGRRKYRPPFGEIQLELFLSKKSV